MNLWLSWIVTLDVLKFDEQPTAFSMGASWIVTLDVLKLDHCWQGLFGLKLNSNIRCIEINYNDRAVVWHISWIVTLDVLK